MGRRERARFLGGRAKAMTRTRIVRRREQGVEQQPLEELERAFREELRLEA